MNPSEFWGHDTELRSSVHVPRIPGHDDELRDSVHVPRIPAVKVDLPGGISNNKSEGRAKDFLSDITE